MTNSLWQRTQELFHDALDVEPEARPAWLRKACGSDDEVYRAVEKLLSGHEKAPSFLDEPEQLYDWIDRGDELLGSMIGPYRLDRVIGEGGMGVVYEARQEEPLQRTVALKLIQMGMATREVLARFDSERQSLAVLDHPNIAKVFDAGATEEGRPFFVMEHVDGQAVTTYCDEQRLGTRQRLELFIAVCRAAHHAHQKGIIHRDLKPSNILVTEHDGAPVAKIIDFGVARAVERPAAQGTALTRLGRLVGTPGYMSPEQEAGALDVDIRSDVYALGVVLYELLVGQLPFAATATDRASPSWREALRGDEPPTPSTRVTDTSSDRVIAEKRGTSPAVLRQELRGDLDAVVMKTLAKDRERRYGTASELGDELRRHLHDEPVLAGPTSIGYHLGKFVRRNRVAVTLAAGALLLLLAFSGVTFFQAVELRRALATSELETRKAEEATTFLIDLFRTSDPRQANGTQVTAREILDRGARRISSELAEQPEVQAKMMATIGEIYTFLGLFEDARRLNDQSLQIRRNLLGDGHPDVADTYLQLAELERFEDNYEAAEEAAKKSLDLYLAAYGEQHREAARALTILSIAQNNQGDYEEAERSVQRALAIWEVVAPPEDHDAVSTLNEQGRILQNLGRFEEAAEPLRRAIELGQRTLSPDHPDVATRKQNLASVMSSLGRFAEAEALLLEALATRRKIFGDDHLEVARAMNNLARNYQHLGKVEEGEKMLRETLAMQRRLQGNDAYDVAIAALNLGVSLRQQGRYAEAEEMYREALAIEQRVLGPDHPNVAIPHHNLAVLLRRQERFEEAETQMQRAVAILQGALGADHPNTARSLAALGKIVVMAGRPGEAEPILRQARAVQTESLPEGHWRTAQTGMYLGQCLTALDRFREAEPLLTSAHQGLEDARGTDDEQTREAASSLVTLYEAWARPADAERYRAQLADVEG